MQGAFEYCIRTRILLILELSRLQTSRAGHSLVYLKWVHNMGIFVFKEGVWGNFFRFTLKAFISIRVTLGIIQNDYFDHVRHVWDIFGTIRSLKIIFWDYIFENFRLKMNKNTFFGILWLYKGNYYLFKLRNEEFRCLRSEYMTIIIS